MRLSQTSTLALMVALGAESSATDVFDQWQRSVDLEHLAPAQYPLLPLICHRLERLGIAHPWLPRLKGIYRKTWYANQVAQSAMADVVAALQIVGVQPVAVGGLALAPTCYPDLALRPIQPPAIVVPGRSATASLHALLAQGWQPEPATPHLLRTDFQTWVTGQRFVNDQRHALWIGWHIAPFLPCADLNAACLGETVPLTLGSTTLLTLSPTDHLLRACLGAGETSLIEYVDATFLIRNGAIDWSRLAELANRFSLGAAVADTLDTLSPFAPVGLSPAARNALRCQPASADDRRSVLVARRLPVSNATRARFERLYARYLRLAACHGTRPGPRSFATFLQHNYRLDSPWQIPRVVAGRLLCLPQRAR